VEEQATFCECKGYFDPISQFYPKNIYTATFLPTNFLLLLVHYIFLCHVAIDLEIENLVVLEIWFLITRMKNVRYAVQQRCQTSAGSVF